MMYKNDFVAVVKVNGKVVREKDGSTIQLPFGSEYTIALKNKRFVRCLVDIFIDGSWIGGSLILRPHEEVNLERFIDSPNKFRFIQKTREIQDYRGDKIDDGIITVKFRFEKVTYKPERKILLEKYNDIMDDNTYRHARIGGLSRGCDMYYNSPNTTGDIVNASLRSTIVSNAEVTPDAMLMDKPADDEGITVKGSHSDQKFVSSHIEELEDETHVINFEVRGFQPSEESKTDEDVIYVQSKITCPTCGTRSRASAKFCSNCGTALDNSKA